MGDNKIINHTLGDILITNLLCPPHNMKLWWASRQTEHIIHGNLLVVMVSCQRHPGEGFSGKNLRKNKV